MAFPIDASTKQEIQDLIKNVLGTFTLQYVKFYALGMVKKAETEAGADPGPDWKLQSREDKSTEPLKTGFLTKEGAIRKSWKKRFFVVRPDYVVEYLEDNTPKAKSKGKMLLSGYRVVEDPNAGLIQQLEKLAEMMKIDTSELPKPKKYPELVFEVHHHRRRCYFIEAANAQEKQEWVNMFRTVCWYAYGFENRDPVHKIAFQNAIRETRWSLGRWGWWGGGGSETQVLSDLISDELDYAIMGRIYSKLQGPWIIRSKVRDQVLKFIDTMVMAAVTPAWAAMSKTVEEIRPKIEPTIKELVDPLGKQKAELINKMKDGCVSIVNPLIDQHVMPHLGKVLEVIKSPVVDGYDTAATLLMEQFDKFATKFNPATSAEHFRDLDQWSRWSWWEARPATSKFDVMYEPLWVLREIFADIYPWSTIYHGQDQLRKLLDNGVYTFQLELTKAVEEKSDNPVEYAKTNVMERFRADAKISTFLFYLKLFKDILMPTLLKLVMPPVKVVLDPMASLIPDPMKQFIDIYDMFDRLLNGIVDDVLKNMLK